MKLSERGFDEIKHHEGCRLKAYRDHGRGVYTIGWGHTQDVTEGMVIRQETADRLLHSDVERFERLINRCVTYPRLSQAMFDALVSWAFNVGEKAVLTSTLLVLLNNGEISSAADEFRVWKYSGGRVDTILVARRERERALFLIGTGLPT